MASALYSILLEHPRLSLIDGMFVQRDFEKDGFENVYISLRDQEGRLYDDATVRQLPHYPPGGPLAKEWASRRRSTQKMIRYLASRKPGRILELGCGNGWLTGQLHRELKTPCCGADVNKSELAQAVRVFGGSDELCFVYGDALALFRDPVFDRIVVASALQYFPDPVPVIRRLLSMLNPGGEIHILDTPFYQSSEKEAARTRSKDYFQNSGMPEMNRYYFHHSLCDLHDFTVKVMYDPSTPWHKITRKIFHDSPFPWIIIPK